MISVVKRGEFFYLEYTEFGKRVRKSTKLRATKANEAYIHRQIIPPLEMKLAQGVPTNLKLNFSHFADLVRQRHAKERKLNTQTNTECAFKKFFEVLGDRNVENYSVFEIERYANSLNGKTARAYLSPVRLAFKIALKHGIIAKNPCDLITMPKVVKKERSPFDADTVKSLLAYAKGELKLFLYIAFYTGARAGEILALEWDDIRQGEILINKTKLQNGTINSPKNGKARVILIPQVLSEFLERQRGSGAIFSLNYERVRFAFSKLQQELGLKPQGLHITRHTYASLLLTAGSNPLLVREMLGHSSLDMTSHYAHLLKDTANKLAIEKALNLG